MKLIAENDTTGYRALLSPASDMKPANLSNVFPVVRHAREVLQALLVVLNCLFLYFLFAVTIIPSYTPSVVVGYVWHKAPKIRG